VSSQVRYAYLRRHAWRLATTNVSSIRQERVEMTFVAAARDGALRTHPYPAAVDVRRDHYARVAARHA
jgi:hypothetical protein